MQTKWIYYNHALVPDVAPHEKIEIPKFDRKFWNNSGKYPLLAQWITNFDCEEETSFWYIIKSDSYDITQLSKSARKHIRQALKKCYVRECQDNEAEDLYLCYKLAYERYENADNFRSIESIKKEFLNRKENNMFYYGAYELETDQLIGFFACTQYKNYLEINMSKFNPQYMSLRPSDALHDYVLGLWLNKPEIKYVSSGSRCINHETNVQEYKINTFGFRKAYCRLHIKYRPSVYIVVKILYYFRHILRQVDGNKFIHKINTVLRMEELTRI